MPILLLIGAVVAAVALLRKGSSSGAGSRFGGGTSPYPDGAPAGTYPEHAVFSNGVYTGQADDGNGCGLFCGLIKLAPKLVANAPKPDLSRMMPPSMAPPVGNWDNGGVATYRDENDHPPFETATQAESWVTSGSSRF